MVISGLLRTECGNEGLTAALPRRPHRRPQPLLHTSCQLQSAECCTLVMLTVLPSQTPPGAQTLDPNLDLYG